MKHKSQAYVFTAQADSKADMDKIKELRSTVRMLNRMARRLHPGCTTVRVVVKPRLGRGNPAAYKYKDQWIKSIKMEDATRFDVYIHDNR